MTVQRNVVFGLDPLRGLTGTYSWGAVADFNDDAAGITVAHVPSSRGGHISILQETMFLGTINTDLVMQTFRHDLATDGDQPFVARAITNRIDPSILDRPQVIENPQLKMFWQVEFFDSNPVKGGASIRYTRDSLDPTLSSTVWENFKGLTSADRFAFNNQRARWVHIEIKHMSIPVLQPVFGGFDLSYIELGSRERSRENAAA